MFGVLATSLFEASRAAAFSQVPLNEDWRLAEARRREGASSEREEGANSPAPRPTPSYSRPHSPTHR